MSLKQLLHETGRYYYRMNRFSWWLLAVTAVLTLLLWSTAAVVPHTALTAVDPVLAIDLIDQCRGVGGDVLTVGLVLSFLADIVIQHDKIEI